MRSFFVQFPFFSDNILRLIAHRNTSIFPSSKTNFKKDDRLPRQSGRHSMTQLHQNQFASMLEALFAGTCQPMDMDMSKKPGGSWRLFA